MTEQIDMARFIEAKSDQLNADDLIGTSRTITVTKVTGSDGDQPISIFYQGDNGKPFKPCKTIRRVLMAVWGQYANDYVGRSMTLYRDDRVTFGGLDVGGIRISHMSHIDKETIVVVMKSKGKKAGVKILPLGTADQKPASEAFTIDQARTDLKAAASLDELKTAWSRKIMAPYRTELQADLDARKVELSSDSPAAAALPGETSTQEPGGAAPFGSADEGPDDSQRGEHDPMREAADRLIAMKRGGEVRSGKDQGDYEALPDELRQEVDAA